MPSIFEDESLKEMLRRVDTIRIEYKPLWGKMNTAQMFAHLNATLEAPLGITKPASEVTLFTRWIVRPIALSNMPIKKGAPTAKAFVAPTTSEYQTEKQKLLRNLQAAHDNGLNGKWEPHVSFGKLTPEEWGRLIYKHVNHHLEQFGG